MLQGTSRFVPPTFDSLVPGRLVHRRHLNDVLVTDSQPAGVDVYSCGVQWPPNHILFGRGAGIDAALVAETVRQVTTHVSHIHYGVPLDTQFLMNRLQLSVTRTAGIRLTAPNLVVTLRMEEVRRNKTTLTSFVSRLVIEDDLGPVAAGAGFARLVTAAAYRRTRASAPPTRAPAEHTTPSRPSPGEVGVLDSNLVLVAPSPLPLLYRLVVDPTNAAFFDHELDHVPGMALLEAGRQALRHTLRDRTADFSEADFTFEHLLGLDEATFIRVVPIDDRESHAQSYSLEFTQNGRVGARGMVRLQRVAVTS